MQAKYKVLIVDVNNNNRIMVEDEFEQVFLRGINGVKVEEYYKFFGVEDLSDVIKLCEHTIERVNGIIKEENN